MVSSFKHDGKNVEADVNDRGDVEVAIQDQFTEIVDLFLCLELNSITLSSNSEIDTNTISLVAGHNVVAGDAICLKENRKFYQGIVIDSTDNVITLDSPLDYAFTTAATASRRLKNMNVDGSSSPIIFSITPPENTSWDITRMLITILDNAAMNDGTFGGITALTNGVVFRKKDGDYKNIFNAKKNGDLRAHAYDVAYLEPFLPTGTYGFGCRRSFNGPDKNGVTIRLNAGDEFQVIIQDDLTDLSEFVVVAQGHVID